IQHVDCQLSRSFPTRRSSDLSPGFDLLVIAGRENLGNGSTLEHLRAGVLRIFEQAVGEALLSPGGRIAHHPRQQPNTRVDQRHRSEEHTSELQSLAYLVCRLL